MARLTIHIFIVLCVCVATVWVINSSLRYRTVASDLSESFQPPPNLQGWRHSHKGVDWLDRHHRVLEFTAQGINQFSYISKSLVAPQHYRNLKVTVEMRVDQAYAQAEHGYAGVILLCFDKRHDFLWYWPNVIAQMYDFGPWQAYSRIIPVNEKCERMYLETYLNATAGKLYMRNLNVYAMEEKTFFFVSRVLLIIVWAALIAWTFRRLISLPGRRFLDLIALLTGVGVLVGGIMPQPYLNDLLRFTIYGVQDVVQEAKQFVVSTTPDEEDSTKPQAATAKSIAGHAASSSLGQSPDTDLDLPEVSKVPESPLELNTPTPVRDYWTPEWENFDKKEHILSFYFLGLVTAIAYNRFGWRRTLMGLVTLSAAIQSMQSLTVTREFGFDDMAADLIGITLGFSSAALGVTLWRRRLRSSHETR